MLRLWRKRAKWPFRLQTRTDSKIAVLCFLDVERSQIKRGVNMLTSGPVVVMQVPEQFKGEEARSFVKEVGPLLETNRPRIVLECSQVRSMDSAGVETLLQCLEE